MKLKENGRIALCCIATMLVMIFLLSPKTVLVEKHRIDHQIFYIVDLGSDGKWITQAHNNHIRPGQSWINTKTGDSCVKISGLYCLPFVVDSNELNGHVLEFWAEESSKRLVNISGRLDD